MPNQEATGRPYAPEISIIIPVYNMERYLPQCVESVLNQTFANFELILADDGSIDSSPAICDEFARRDSRVRVLHLPNGGVSEARNAGIAAANGRYVGFVDSDDWIEPGMYETLRSDLLAYNADIAVCGYIFEWKNRSKQRHDPSLPVERYSREDALALILADTPLQSMIWDKLFRREMLTHQFPKGVFFEDHATTVKWFANAERGVVFNPMPLYHYRMRRGSTVNGMNPERRFHFLLAELERVKFLRGIGFLNPSDSASGAARVLTVAVDVAKNIARSVADPETRSRYLDRVISTVAPFVPAASGVLGGKTRSRLMALLHNKRAFVRRVRFSLLFEFGRGRKVRNLFP